MFYSVIVYPEQYCEVKEALELTREVAPHIRDKRIARRLLDELEGIGELGRGRPNQMFMKREDAEFLKGLIEVLGLNLRVSKGVR